MDGSRDRRHLLHQRLRRVRYRRGTEPIPINELVSPLRYDLVIRERFFDFVVDSDCPRSMRVPELIARAETHEYFEWFRTIAFPRFHANRRRTTLTDAFAARVRKSVALLEDFNARGFDPRYPLSVRGVPAGTRTSSGKVLSQRWYPSDGCHRVALLHRAGFDLLLPHQYVVRSENVAVYDVTSVLLPRLGVSRADYDAFLALGYGDGSTVGREALVGHVAQHRPERLSELESVLAVDDGCLYPFDRTRQDGE